MASRSSLDQIRCSRLLWGLSELERAAASLAPGGEAEIRALRNGARTITSSLSRANICCPQKRSRALVLPPMKQQLLLPHARTRMRVECRFTWMAHVMRLYWFYWDRELWGTELDWLPRLNRGHGGLNKIKVKTYFLPLLLDY